MPELNFAGQSTDRSGSFVRRRPDRDGRGVCARNATRGVHLRAEEGEREGEAFPHTARCFSSHSSSSRPKAHQFPPPGRLRTKFRFSDGLFIASYLRQLTTLFPKIFFERPFREASWQRAGSTWYILTFLFVPFCSGRNIRYKTNSVSFNHSVLLTNSYSVFLSYQISTS